MEQQLKYEEWFFQSDYDLETAQFMLQSGRNIYCIFMCHLSLEKALKGLFIKKIDSLSIPTRYPEDLKAMIALYTPIQTTSIHEQTKTIQQWLKQQ